MFLNDVTVKIDKDDLKKIITKALKQEHPEFDVASIEFTKNVNLAFDGVELKLKRREHTPLQDWRDR